MDDKMKSYFDKLLLEKEMNEMGTDFASPDDRQSAMYSALQGEMQGMMPDSQKIPMEPINDIVEADNAPNDQDRLKEMVKEYIKMRQEPQRFQDGGLSMEEKREKALQELENYKPKEQKLGTGDYLPDVFAGLHNVINYAQGSQQPNLKLNSIESAKKAFEKQEKERKENLEKKVKLYNDFIKGKDKQKWGLTTLEDPETGEPKVFRVNPATGEKEEIGTRGYSNKLIKDPITGNYIDPRTILRGEKLEEKQSEKGKGTFGKLTPNQRKELKDLKSSFEKETLKVRDSYDKIKGLSDKQLELAINNPIAASQLGAQVATIFENGRLTDEDVVRYTRRQGIPDRIADTIINLKNGTISESKASEIKESLKVFEQVLQDQINRRALGKAKSMEENYGIPSKDLVKNVYPDYKAPKILVKLPNGKKGRIDSDKIEDFLSKYPDAEIME